MKKQTYLLGAILISTLILSGCGSQGGNDSATNQALQQQVIEKSADGSVEVIQMTSAAIQYDGEHGIKALGRSRHAPDQLTITLSIDDTNTITAVQDIHQYGHPKSRQYQSFFQQAIAAEVVGKSLDEVDNLHAIGGASTTTEARNAAIIDMQSQLSNAG